MLRGIHYWVKTGLMQVSTNEKKELTGIRFLPIPVETELAATMDRSVEQMAAAFELLDFGQWTEIIRSVVYEGLYAVGGAVLHGTFRKRPKREERNPTRKAGP